MALLCLAVFYAYTNTKQSCDESKDKHFLVSPRIYVSENSLKMMFLYVLKALFTFFIPKAVCRKAFY